jgi:LysM repeat protein
MRVKWLLVGLLITGMLLPGITYAQDGGNNPPLGGTTIHVVQRGENLYRIAMQYGTTVEAIAEANGITDPRYIAVGQRLLIPNVQLNAPGAVMTHMVVPGDSLETLAYTYHTTADRLAAANSITNPALIFAGEDLTINQGSDSIEATPSALVQVAPGDNLFRMALRYRVPVNSLVSSNQLNPIVPVYPGQRLWLPGGNDSTTLIDLTAPLTSFTLSPVPAVQGKTIGIRAQTIGPATLSGTFLGYPIQFVTQDANQHFAVFGIHAFANSGVYPMVVTITTPDGGQSTQTFRVRVDEGGYGVEDISLDTTQQDLLNPQVTEPEWEKVATLMSSFT